MLVVGVLLIGLYRLGAVPEGAPVQAEQAVQTSGWEVDLLAALGNVQPSAETVTFLGAWHRAEGGAASFNPLNTTQDAPGATCYNVDPCVKNYPSYEVGMQATVETLLSDHPGYAEIVAGLQTNDVARAFDGIVASPWGTHAALIADVYAEMAPVPAPVAQDGAYASNPIAIGGDDCGWNIQVALEANGGALQEVRIAPSETFSFNATMGNPDAIPYRTCMGVPGGNWCNLAARYAQVARALGLVPQFQDHGVGDLGGGPENSVAIWNKDGIAGAGQDLLVTNTTDRPVFFVARSDGATVTIEGGTP